MCKLNTMLTIAGKTIFELEDKTKEMTQTATQTQKWKIREIK